MKPIIKSYTGLCADARSVFPTWQKKAYKKKWLQDVELFVADTPEGEIICTSVYINTDENKTPLMMDVITGTCYREDGSCLTSDYLKIQGLRTEQGLDQKLIAIKKSTLVGG